MCPSIAHAHTHATCGGTSQHLEAYLPEIVTDKHICYISTLFCQEHYPLIAIFASNGMPFAESVTQST